MNIVYPTLQSPMRLPRWQFMLLAGLLLLALLSQYWSQVAPLAPTPEQTASQFGKLPLAFIPNQGQVNPDVKMHAHGMGGWLSFLPNEVELAFPPVASSMPSSVRLQFSGSNVAPTISAGEQLPGVINFFVGNDATRWRTNIPTYASIQYLGLYDGIDLRYDGHDGTLKGTYLVAAGADPYQIRWHYAGAERVEVDKKGGDLLIQLPGGQLLTEQAPIAWQDREGQRVPVKVQYTVGRDTIGFSLGSYDPSYPLTIDPTLIYSTYLGGGADEVGRGVAVDGQGNVYVVGETSSLNFPLANPYQNGRNGDTTDLFITKLNAAGTARVYSTYLGGTGTESGLGIAVDQNGNAYLTGATGSGDFPTRRAFQPENNGQLDAFVTKLNPAGNTLVFSTYLGGSDNENGTLTLGGIAVDTEGKVYIAGSTLSEDFPLMNAAHATLAGETDAFVARLSAEGTALDYSTYIGGSSYDRAHALAIDPSGNAYITGSTHSIDLPTVNALQSSNAGPGNYDAFVAKLDAEGSEFGYVTYLGGSGNEEGYGIAVDNAGSAYLTGHTTNSDDFPLVDRVTGLGDGGEAYLVKLAPFGEQIIYSARFGGNGRAYSAGITLGPGESVYISGAADSQDFPALNPIQVKPKGGADAYVLRVDMHGCMVTASTYVGGSDNENLNDVVGAVAVDSTGNAYIAGTTYSSDLPVKEAVQSSSGGLSDAFVTKIAMEPTSGCRQVFLPMLSR